MIPLPIDPHLPKIISTLRSCGSLVLTAPPGAGKTTRIPRALFDSGFADHGEILILEPRRLAARLAASRVAQEFGEKLGETVGYSIRYENVSGPKTRIRFLTEAILARRIIHDPNLNGVSTVILDEFHERNLATDLALAFLKQLQKRKPDLKIIVMSATMDAQPVANFLANTSVLSVEGSPFSLDIEYELKPNDRPLHEKVTSAVTRLIRTQISGDILVFLPGSGEIRRAAEALKPASEQSGILVLPLHGDLPAAEQKRAIDPAERTKAILATNVAETSITIPGIAAVVDSGLARIAGHSAWSGFPTLATAKISKSSAIQRAGRAGRTQAGKVIRLYTRHDFESRPEHEIAEINRADLTETVLMLHGAGVKDAGGFEWFEPPPDSALSAAEALLIKLGAINENREISDTGVRMLQLPVHPRLARLIIEGEKLQAADDSTLLAALISERDIRLDVRADFGILKSKTREHASGPSDLLELLDCFREAEAVKFSSDGMRAIGLDARAVQAVERSRHQLRRILFGAKQGKTQLPDGKQKEEALLIATLAAFPDRVAKRRKTGSRELVLAGGGSAVLSQASIVHKPPFIVAVDVEERKENVPTKISGVLIRLASAIEPEWLAGLYPESISQKIILIWNEKAGRVEELRQTSYGEISLEETVKTAHPSEEASRLLASAVFARASLPFRDIAELPAYQARLALISKTFPEENLPEIGDSEMRESVEQLCRQKRSLEELEPLSILDTLMDRFSERQRALIRREAPERIKLKSGRAVKIHYEAAKGPWIESRLQDFFGTFSTPAICSGRVSLTIHLLAPNQRAVQVTQDLAGFWKNHYPAVRRELQRRYPKHAWPDPESLRKG
jgi:ATP-dependent helicase HrpB